MKLFICCLLIISKSIANGQRNSDIMFIESTLKLNPDNTYVFCRGTKSKSQLIAHKFNISDTNITHIGIGFMKNGKAKIYNVSDLYFENNALHIDSIESFIKTSDVYFISVWRMDIDLNISNKIKTLCEEYSKRQIFFDRSFTISNNDTLYCSEFCATILNNTNSDELKFSPVSKKLNNSLYESVLKREVLTYYPVDFFQSSQKFIKVFEYKLNR